MYLPDDQGEYVPESGMQNFSVQGLSDAFTSLESETTVVQPPAEEYTLLLEVTKADLPGHLHQPAFSLNTGMVLHILKGDPSLRDLEYVQMDSPGMAYLFFYDKQGCRGLKQDAMETLRAHMAEAFSEWISHSVHFVVILLLLMEGWWRAKATSDRCHQKSRTEYSNCPVPHMVSSESDSMLPLVGSTPPSAVWMGQLEEGGSHTPRALSTQPRGRPPKACSTKDGMGNSQLSSPDRGGMDSDGYFMVSEAQSTHYHRRRQWGEKRLAPTCLDVPIFKSTDPNTEVMYTLWRFDVQGWLDQNQEESMMPHIYNSLRGYPS